MPVVVDDQPLSVDDLGLTTFGQVLTHLQKANRLVVRVLVDGEEPDYQSLAALRATPTRRHTIFVETAEPRQIADEVLGEITAQLDEADRLSTAAAGELSAGNQAKAFEQLSGCFGRWQHAQESFSKIAQLLRIDLDRLSADGVPMREFLTHFGGQLRSIKDTIEARDFVALADILRFELPESTRRWRSAVEAARGVVG